MSQDLLVLFDLLSSGFKAEFLEIINLIISYYKVSVIVIEESIHPIMCGMSDLLGTVSVYLMGIWSKLTKISINIIGYFLKPKYLSLLLGFSIYAIIFRKYPDILFMVKIRYSIIFLIILIENDPLETKFIGNEADYMAMLSRVKIDLLLHIMGGENAMKFNCIPPSTFVLIDNDRQTDAQPPVYMPQSGNYFWTAVNIRDRLEYYIHVKSSYPNWQGLPTIHTEGVFGSNFWENFVRQTGYVITHNNQWLDSQGLTYVVFVELNGKFSVTIEYSEMNKWARTFQVTPYPAVGSPLRADMYREAVIETFKRESPILSQVPRSKFYLIR